MSDSSPSFLAYEKYPRIVVKTNATEYTTESLQALLDFWKELMDAFCQQKAIDGIKSPWSGHMMVPMRYYGVPDSGNGPPEVMEIDVFEYTNASVNAPVKSEDHIQIHRRLTIGAPAKVLAEGVEKFFLLSDRGEIPISNTMLYRGLVHRILEMWMVPARGTYMGWFAQYFLSPDGIYGSKMPKLVIAEMTMSRKEAQGKRKFENMRGMVDRFVDLQSIDNTAARMGVNRAMDKMIRFMPKAQKAYELGIDTTSYWDEVQKMKDWLKVVSDELERAITEANPSVTEEEHD